MTGRKEAKLKYEFKYKIHNLETILSYRTAWHG